MEIIHEVARAYENKGEVGGSVAERSFSIKGIEKSKRTAKELIVRNTKPKTWWEAHVLRHQPVGLRLWLLLVIASPLLIIVGAFLLVLMNIYVALRC